MSTDKQGSQNVGADSRDQSKPRRPFIKHAYKDWRVWAVAIVLISLVLVYVMTNNLSLRPGSPEGQPMPAVNAL